MKPKAFAAGIAIAVAFVLQTRAQTYDTNNVVVANFAGSGFSGLVDGIGEQTMFSKPSQIVNDSLGNFFVLDFDNRLIRKITSDGTVSILTGCGTNVSLPTFMFPYAAIAIGHSNTLWIAAPVDLPFKRSYLLRVDPGGCVTSTPFDSHSFSGACVDSADNLYLSDDYANIIYRQRTNGVFEVFVGSGNLGSADGNGVFTSFSQPRALGLDAADNIYVWDSGNHLIRRINRNGDVVTIAGNGNASDQDGEGTVAGFSSISSMTVDQNGNVIMACGSSIRKMSAATNVTTIAGSFSQSSYANGLGALARFNGASGVCLSQGLMFVADSNNHRIRQISSDPQPQQVADSNLGIHNYAGITISGLVGRTYQIQSSPDQTNWTARTTLLLTASPYLWFDLNPISGSKFYRAFLLP